MHDDLLVIFPGALGDFICLWPTLHALRARIKGRITIVAKPDLLALLDPACFERFSIDRREISDLFASEPAAASTRSLLSSYRNIHSWTGHAAPGFRARLASLVDGPVHVHPFRSERPNEHATDYYARCVGAVALSTVAVHLESSALRWARDLWNGESLGPRTLVYHPGSGSPQKNWAGMQTAVLDWRKLGGRAVCLRGPAETSDTAHGSDLTIDNESLPRVAALLGIAPLYLGNDSGISHLAGAVGTPSVVIFGPSDPAKWRPRGHNVHVLSVADSCHLCAPASFCTHRLSPATVLAALLAKVPN